MAADERELKDQLLQALESRDIIGQAKGILMERHRIDADEAFARLVRVSQNTNTKLRDVAAIVARGHPAGASRSSRRTGPAPLARTGRDP